MDTIIITAMTMDTIIITTMTMDTIIITTKTMGTIIITFTATTVIIMTMIATAKGFASKFAPTRTRHMERGARNTIRSTAVSARSAG
jgi:hypothetical protein